MKTNTMITMFMAIIITTMVGCTEKPKETVSSIKVAGNTVSCDVWTYVGQHRGEVFEGKGKLTYVYGDVWEGTWVNGNMVEGKVTKQNGDIYVGQTSNWEYNGKGSFTSADGWSYEGEWAHDKPNGQGEMITKDHTRYIGGFKDGDPVTAKMITSNCLKGDCYSGYGILVTDEGTYKGNFSMGLFDGEGTMKYVNGDYYKGGWSSGSYQGGAIHTTKEGTFNGVYKAGQMWRGTVVYNDGRPNWVIMAPY